MKKQLDQMIAWKEENPRAYNTLIHWAILCGILWECCLFMLITFIVKFL